MRTSFLKFAYGVVFASMLSLNTQADDEKTFFPNWESAYGAILTRSFHKKSPTASDLENLGQNSRISLHFIPSIGEVFLVYPDLKNEKGQNVIYSSNFPAYVFLDEGKVIRLLHAAGGEDTATSRIEFKQINGRVFLLQYNHSSAASDPPTKFMWKDGEFKYYDEQNSAQQIAPGDAEQRRP